MNYEVRSRGTMNFRIHFDSDWWFQIRFWPSLPQCNLEQVIHFSSKSCWLPFFSLLYPFLGNRDSSSSRSSWNLLVFLIISKKMRNNSTSDDATHTRTHTHTNTQEHTENTEKTYTKHRETHRKHTRNTEKTHREHRQTHRKHTEQTHRKHT